MQTRGRLIAAAVATLLSASTAFAGDPIPTKEAKVKCSGINACKGKGSCQSAGNACKGQNGCKAKGWVETTADACKTGHGTVVVDKPGAPK